MLSSAARTCVTIFIYFIRSIEYVAAATAAAAAAAAAAADTTTSLLTYTYIPEIR